MHCNPPDHGKVGSVLEEPFSSFSKAVPCDASGFHGKIIFKITIMKIFCTLGHPAEDAGGTQVQIGALQCQVKSGMCLCEHSK